MNCRDVREQLLEVAVEGGPASPEIQPHFDVCVPCARVEQMKKTMALLDEWQAPEPSPYFNVRLQARLREEQQKTCGGMVFLAYVVSQTGCRWSCGHRSARLGRGLIPGPAR